MIVPLNKFQDYLRGKTVAVVGNGPDATGATIIDNCDVVIRFNRFRLGYNVGTKTDVVCMPIDYSRAYTPQETLDQAQPEWIFAVASELNFGVKNGIKHWSKDWDVSLIDIDSIRDMGRLMGCHPTTGIRCLQWIIEQSDAKSVYTTGFSFKRTKDHHYYNEQTYDFNSHCPVKELHYVAMRGWYNLPYVRFDPNMTKQLLSDQPSYELKEHNKRGGKHYSACHRWVYDQIKDKITPASNVLEVGAGIGYGASVLKDVANLTLLEPEKETYEYLLTKSNHLCLNAGLMESYSTRSTFISSSSSNSC